MICWSVVCSSSQQVLHNHSLMTLETALPLHEGTHQSWRSELRQIHVHFQAAPLCREHMCMCMFASSQFSSGHGHDLLHSHHDAQEDSTTMVCSTTYAHQACWQTQCKQDNTGHMPSTFTCTDGHTHTLTTPCFVITSVTNSHSHNSSPQEYYKYS